MPKYIVFSDMSPSDPPPDPQPVPAVITDAADEQLAIEAVSKARLLVPGEGVELHACDISGSHTFTTHLDVSTEHVTSKRFASTAGSTADAPASERDHERAP